MARIAELEFPDELFYDAKERLWLRPAPGGEVTVGIDAGGHDALGAAVYLQLADPGRHLARGEALGSLEAEKMVRPLLAPVSGMLVAVNRAAMATPRLLSSDPYGGGWLFRIRASDWEDESRLLLFGSEAVTAWVKAELAVHPPRGASGRA